MEEQKAANTLRRADYKVHKRDGIWWLQVAPFFCKPVDPFRTIRPLQSAPKLQYSLLGYSHPVPDTALSTKTWAVMYMGPNCLSAFGIAQLKPKRRSSVRKALRHVEIKQIEEIKPMLDSMNEICISVAKRTGHGKPPDFYIKKRQEWERFMVKEFSIVGREWWGAYAEGQLIAYFYAYLINATMFISAAKSHSDFLGLLPNDAFVFTFLEYCRELEGCKRVVYGDWSPDAPSLNQFKARYGFERKDVPEYRHERISFSLLEKAARVIRRSEK
jgi:hypothetical protein